MGATALNPPFGAYAPTSGQSALIRLARTTPLRRGVFRQFLSGSLTALRPGALDVDFRGARFRVSLTGNTTEAALVLNEQYNSEELDFLREGLAPGGVFVDVGANIGLYSLTLAAAVGPGGAVIAIEPDPVMRERLLTNRSANRADQVQVFACAVGDHTGEVSFIQDSVNMGHNRVGEGGNLIVPIQPLKDLLDKAEVTRIHALKIDVEGFEDQVLNPFFADAPRSLWPSRVVIEKIHADPGQITPVDRLLGLGYRQAGGNRANVFLVRDDAA